MNRKLPSFLSQIPRATARNSFCTAVLAFTFQSLSADPFSTERAIIQLSHNWQKEMMMVSEYKGLKSFCDDNAKRLSVIRLLDEIHHHHELLETELRSTGYAHSHRTIGRILKQMDKLSEEHHPKAFAEFFREQCWIRYRTEKNSKAYNTGFGTHSYGGRIYEQEMVANWYLKRLSKRIGRIQKLVEHFYRQRMAWEHRAATRKEHAIRPEPQTSDWPAINPAYNFASCPSAPCQAFSNQWRASSHSGEFFQPV